MSDLLEDVRDATRALAELALEDGVLWPRMSAALRATCDDVERRLTSKELAILLVGPPDGGKRTLMNTAIGAELLRQDAREPAAVVLVRHGDEARYVCELRDGGIQGLASTLREKTRLVGEELSRAERELADTDRRVLDLRRRLGDVRARSAKTRRIPRSSVGEAFRRLWKRLGEGLVAFVAWVTAFAARAQTWRRRLTPPASAKAETTVALAVAEPAKPVALAKDERFERILELERALLDAEPRLEDAKKAVARARADASEHAAERARIFLTEVRALTDADARGSEIVEIAIDHPSTLLPPGLVLVDAPELTHADEQTRDAAWERVRDDLGGCIVVSPGGRTNLVAPDLLARLDPIAPHGVRGLVRGIGSQEEASAELAARLRSELPVLFARMREESPTVVAAFVTRVVKDRLQTLARACATTGAEIETQLAAWEERRATLARELRQRTLSRMRPMTEDAARRTLQMARDTLRTRINDLGDEWRDEIAASEGRSNVDACIERVNANAPERLRTLCDGLATQIARDLQIAGDTLQALLLDELSVADRTASGDGPAPVILGDAAGLDTEDAPPSVRDLPLATTHDAFERKRVGIGIGGAAAGAALGTLIFPGVGTAVGAMIGVLAGLVEGTSSLKRRAIEHVRAHGAAVESEIAARLDGAVSSAAQDLAAALDETVERAIAQRQGVFAHVFDETDRAISREHAKLEELARLGVSLAAQEARFLDLAGRAGSALQALAAARGPSRRS